MVRKWRLTGSLSASSCHRSIKGSYYERGGLTQYYWVRLNRLSRSIDRSVNKPALWIFNFVFLSQHSEQVVIIPLQKPACKKQTFFMKKISNCRMPFKLNDLTITLGFDSKLLTFRPLFETFDHPNIISIYKSVRFLVSWDTEYPLENFP